MTSYYLVSFKGLGVTTTTEQRGRLVSAVFFAARKAGRLRLAYHRITVEFLEDGQLPELVEAWERPRGTTTWRPVSIDRPLGYARYNLPLIPANT